MTPREKIEHWLTDIVIALKLCPFAALPWAEKTVRISIYSGKNEESFKEMLMDELRNIQSKPNNEIETTLLAATEILGDFFEFTLFIQHAQALLKREGLKGKIQIASFHPNYQFHNVAAEDKQNLTNRSPYPILHLIREDSLEKAIENHADTELIYQRNIDLMRSLNDDQVRALFPYSKP